MEHLKLYEEYIDKVTFEMSGKPPRYWGYKADFIEKMRSWGYVHTTLTKNTDMLIVESDNLNTIKCKKAKRYGIPTYTYEDAFKLKERLYTRITRKNKMGELMKKLGEK